MIDSCRKLFEKLIVSRLGDHLDASGGLADNQYVFRWGRSTLDHLKEIAHEVTSREAYHNQLVGVFAFDVHNAFAPWGYVVSAVRDKNVIDNLIRFLQSYLSDRRIVLSPSSSTKFIKNMISGVPQRPVLGLDF